MKKVQNANKKCGCTRVFVAVDAAVNPIYQECIEAKEERREHI